MLHLYGQTELSVLKHKALRKIYNRIQDKDRGCGNKGKWWLLDLYDTPDIVQTSKTQRFSWAGYLLDEEETRFWVFMGQLSVKEPVGGGDTGG